MTQRRRWPGARSGTACRALIGPRGRYAPPTPELPQRRCCWPPRLDIDDDQLLRLSASWEPLDAPGPVLCRRRRPDAPIGWSFSCPAARLPLARRDHHAVPEDACACHVA